MSFIPSEYRELAWFNDVEILGQKFVIERKESTSFADEDVQDFLQREWIEPQEQDAYDTLDGLNVQNALILRNQKGQVVALCTFTDVPKYSAIDLVIVSEGLRRKGISSLLVETAVKEIEEEHNKEYPKEKNERIPVDVNPVTEAGEKFVENFQSKTHDRVDLIVGRWEDEED